MDRKISEEEFSGYKKQLDEVGYVVVRNLVSREKAAELESDVWDWLESLNDKVSRDDRKTWSGEYYPPNGHGIFKTFGVGQSKACWKARDIKGFYDFYSHCWQTRELITSFDGLSLLKKTRGPTTCWAHTDQAPLVTLWENGQKKNVRDFPGVQGFINLRPCGPQDGGLVIYKGSHKTHQKFFKDNGLADSKESWFMYSSKLKVKPNETEEQRQKKAQLIQNGEKYLESFERIKVCCEPGDAVFWYSRTAHYAVPPETDQHRIVIYVCMMPKKYASEQVMKKRVEAYLTGRTTSHWPCINFRLNPKQPQLYGNKHILNNFISVFPRVQLNDHQIHLIGLRNEAELQAFTSRLETREKKKKPTRNTMNTRPNKKPKPNEK